MLTWSCPTAEEWDEFLLRQSDARESAMLAHLERCSLCQITVNHRREELLALGLKCEPPAMPGVIKLYEWTESSRTGLSISRLAAQNELQDELPQSVTLISPDKRLILKAIRDMRTGETWVHLLADDPSLFKNALVKPFGAGAEVLTDENGRVNIGQVDWKEIESFTAEVRLPRAFFVLNRLPRSEDQSGTTMLVSETGDEIRVTLTDQGSSRQLEIEIIRLARAIEGAPLRVAIKGSSDTPMILATPEARRVRFSHITDEEPIHVYLYQ